MTINLQPAATTTPPPVSDQPAWVRLTPVGGRYQVPDDRGRKYYLDVDPTDYQFVVAGAIYGTPGSRFDHPHVAVLHDLVHEFKHSRPDGHKWYTSRPGTEFLFAIPRYRVEILLAKGYSYIKTRIGRVTADFNVSGGGDGSEWSDHLPPLACIHADCSREQLLNLAYEAVSPWTIPAPHNPKYPDCYRHHLEPLNPEDAAHFTRLACQQAYQGKLEPGQKLWLADGYKVDGQQGPFPVVEGAAPKRHYHLCQTPWGLTKAKYNQIDWLRTAQGNEFDLPLPRHVNRLQKPTP